MRTLLYSLLFLALVSGQERIEFYSKSLAKKVNYQIFYKESETCLPLVLFLHGAGRATEKYQFLFSQLDSLYSAEVIPEMLLVMPNGNQGYATGSFFVNSPLFGNFEDFIVHDLLDHVRSEFDVCPDEYSIIGHSMGGFAAVRLAQKYDTIFNTAIAHSAPLDLKKIEVLIPHVKKEHSGKRFNPASGIYSFLTYCMSGAMSPNLKKRPFKIDPPFTREWEIDPEVIERWELFNPANNVYGNKIKNLYIDVGVKDRFRLYDFTMSFIDSAQKYNQNYTLVIHPNGHSDSLAQQLNLSLKYLSAKLR
jgi:S-formylglutathione hydrolase FrmB